MADTKISNLTAGTTPLAGTEVLPIVQGGVTKQVSVANLTAGRAVSAASLTLSTGSLVPSTAGQGVNFTANSAAAGMTSQLLNWYEEGTWTPTIYGSTSAGTGTYSFQLGKYTRIGRVVYVTMNIVWTAHTGTGNLLIGGLPFTTANDNSYNPAMTLTDSLTLGALNTAVAAFSKNNTFMYMYQQPAGGGAFTSVAMDTAAQVLISGFYSI